MPVRLAALLALVAFVVGGVLLVWAALAAFPRDAVALAVFIAAAAVLWQGVLRRGVSRVVLSLSAAVLAIVGLVLLAADGFQLSAIAGLLLIALSVLLAERAFSVHRHLPKAPRPQRPVLIYNPKSGGGKAITFHLAEEARSRGITPIELGPGDDLEVLVRRAVASGADGLMAAGGDGTQALVASVAAEHDLPFACIPAGTRNHFALDLGVDRNDVVGALDAFVDGGERRVDLGEVDGRTFVNNVSLGLYAEAVQREGYRDAKIRTLIDTIPTMLSSGADGSPESELSWTGDDGRKQTSAAVILVSNNVYRLGRALGSGTRPRLDAGVLGITVIGGLEPGASRRRITSAWEAPAFTVEAQGEVPVGVDGEGLKLPSPLVFRIRPGALRVRIAPQHPGASPSAGQPTGFRDAVRSLWHLTVRGEMRAPRQ